MGFKYEKLNVWQSALELTIQIRKICKSFPNEEKYILSAQIIRAADSVCLNIAEGSTNLSKPEQINFLRYSMRSAIEVTAGLHIALELKYLPIESFDELYIKYEILIKMLNSFIKKVKNQSFQS